MSLTVKILFICLLIILILASGIFSAAETAYTSLNPGKIETLTAKNSLSSKLIKKQYKFFNQTLVTILICNNIVNIAASAMVSYLLSKILGHYADYNVLISTLVMTPLIVLFGEIIPKLIAKSHPIYTAKTLCWLLVFFFYLFFIFAYPISKFGKKIYITNTEQDVKNLIDVAQNEGVLETNESIMAQNALDLDSTKVRKHFVKAKDISFVYANDSISTVKEVFLDTNYSRLPVKNNNDEFIGIILLKDIFHLQKGKVINYLKTIPTLSANISLSRALEILRMNKSQMAFVTDNNSSTEVLGIITIEDILEEIVGEIYDEYDEDEWKEISEISLELYHARSSVKIKDLIKKIEIELNVTKKENEMTLGQWLEHKTHKKLSKSTNFSVEDITFKTLNKINAKGNLWNIEISLGSNAELINESSEIELKHLQ
ncbi:CNNM domain-containing protein [Mycoplasmopsis iners]|uniref:CNNM domain-containing protein n=1 Tax=Mycoplasmopsis iners TaxID=76630 RepID=UPI000497E018|nr:hemolysin family protein [Mycoplasmopsis iners]